MLTTSDPRRAHRRLWHMMAGHTNCDLLFQLSLVFPGFHGVSLLKRKTHIYTSYINWKVSSSIYLPSARSCLLANINIMASRISLSLIILCSSVRASSILSRSAQSTTNIRPCVPVASSKLILVAFTIFVYCRVSYLYSNAAITVEFYPARQHPRH